MEERSRTEYSVRNTATAMISRILALIMGFLTRVVFTHTLSAAYVGVNGLFWDILNVLSLSEFGIGTAITYALYRPIAQHDIEKQKSLMALYRKFYRIVAWIVALAGAALIPFLDMLIKNRPDVPHLTFIYLLYLTNSVCSYILIYKKTLIDAHQMGYIGVTCQTFFWLIQDIFQILVLVFFQSFTGYLCISILCTIGNNLWISGKADKMYPYLKEKETEKLSAEEKKGIFQNMRAMLMHKIGNVVLNNTDNLLLSSMVGIASVARYSNYHLVIASVKQVFDQTFQGINASVGNLGVSEDSDHVKDIFETTFFIGQWIYGFGAICLYELLNSFVEISFGQSYVFSRAVVFVLCLNFYITGMRQAALIFRDSLGLFWYDRYKAVAEAALNLLLSILLAGKYGTIGVFMGTILSTAMTSLWVEPFILYRHALKSRVSVYFLKYIRYAFVMFLAGGCTDFLCSLVQGNVWKIFFGRLPICIFVPNMIFLLIYCRSREFGIVKDKTGKVLKRKYGHK